MSFSYFHFPELAEEGSHGARPPAKAEAGARPVVPATVQYWTSAETRKREYAAIDAASTGVKGLCLKLLPDCMVPDEYRVLGFTEREEDEMRERGRGASQPRRKGRGKGEDGSVRRYRIEVDEGERETEKSRGRWWRFGRG